MTEGNKGLSNTLGLEAVQIGDPAPRCDYCGRTSEETETAWGSIGEGGVQYARVSTAQDPPAFEVLGICKRCQLILEVMIKTAAGDTSGLPEDIRDAGADTLKRMIEFGRATAFVGLLGAVSGMVNVALDVMQEGKRDAE